jgi:hypothetical protein
MVSFPSPSSLPPPRSPGRPFPLRARPCSPSVAPIYPPPPPTARPCLAPPRRRMAPGRPILAPERRTPVRPLPRWCATPCLVPSAHHQLPRSPPGALPCSADPAWRRPLLGPGAVPISAYSRQWPGHTTRFQCARRRVLNPVVVTRCVARFIVRQLILIPFE